MTIVQPTVIYGCKMWDAQSRRQGRPRTRCLSAVFKDLKEKRVRNWKDKAKRKIMEIYCKTMGLTGP